MQTHSRPLNRPTPGPSLRWRGIECPTNEAIYSPSSQGGAWGGLSFCVQYTMKKIFPSTVFYVYGTVNLCSWYRKHMYMVP